MNYNAFYRGIVVDNKDPLGLGKVKVRVPALHGQPGLTSSFISTESIPWATPAIYRGINERKGEYIPYPIDSLVLITFENEDADKPLIFGTLPYNDSDGISNLVGQKKGAYLFKEGAKSYIFVDEESGAMCLRNGDHELQVRKDGVFVIDYKLLSENKL